MVGIDIATVFNFIVIIFKTLFNLIGTLILKIGSFGEIVLIALSLFLGWLYLDFYNKGKIKAWIFWLVIGVLLWITIKLSIGGI